MQIIAIDKTNIMQEHICCAIGNDKQNEKRANTKKEWMKERFDDGLIFKRLDERGKVFIEYMPVEKVWKPIIGSNIMVINCLWVSGQFKGKGFSVQLLDECIKDAKTKKMEGIAVVSSTKTKPFLTDKKFYTKMGFQVVDSAPPYFELLFLSFNKTSKAPAFSENVKKGECSNKKGFSLIYSDQCPFMEDYVTLLTGVLKQKKLQCKVIRLKDYAEAQQCSSPFGTLGIYYNGMLVSHELMTEKKFDVFVNNLLKQN
jgi:Acetyltransferases